MTDSLTWRQDAFSYTRFFQSDEALYDEMWKERRDSLLCSLKLYGDKVILYCPVITSDELDGVT